MSTKYQRLPLQSPLSHIYFSFCLLTINVGKKRDISRVLLIHTLMIFCSLSFSSSTTFIHHHHLRTTVPIVSPVKVETVIENSRGEAAATGEAEDRSPSRVKFSEVSVN